MRFISLAKNSICLSEKESSVFCQTLGTSNEQPEELQPEEKEVNRSNTFFALLGACSPASIICQRCVDNRGKRNPIGLSRRMALLLINEGDTHTLMHTCMRRCRHTYMHVCRRSTLLLLSSISKECYLRCSYCKTILLKVRCKNECFNRTLEVWKTAGRRT